jgi:hypothetical protein
LNYSLQSEKGRQADPQTNYYFLPFFFFFSFRAVLVVIDDS